MSITRTTSGGWLPAGEDAASVVDFARQQAEYDQQLQERMKEFLNSPEQVEKRRAEAEAEARAAAEEATAAEQHARRMATDIPYAVEWLKVNAPSAITAPRTLEWIVTLAKDVQAMRDEMAALWAALDEESKRK